MQISAANLIAAQQAAQAALAAKQAAKAAPTAPAFTLSDFEAGPMKTAEPAKPAVAPVQLAQPQAGAKLGQHINIVI
jgi:hypothetical protein